MSKPPDEQSSVIVFEMTETGPVFQRTFGPFRSREAAEAWCSEHGLGETTPVRGVVVPFASA